MNNKKKIILGAFGIAILASGLTLAGAYYFLGMNQYKLADTMRFFHAMRFIETQFVNEVDDTKLIDGAISGMMQSLADPHSVYMDQGMYKDLVSHTEGSFGGIGVVMGVKDNIITVISAIEGTPGEAAGIQTGDQIIKINDEATKDMPIDQVANKIRGDAGTKVVLTIRRQGVEDKDYEITRSNIETKSVGHEMMDNGIGYIRIASFGERTGQEFKTAYADLEAKGMKGMVLDLRNNPGGLLTASVDIANMLVPKGKIVSIDKRDGSEEVHESTLEQVKYPLVVLINGGSASAAEIVAGAIQDTQAGTLVGTKSYGKGSVQVVMPMYGGTALKLTIAKYYTPSGRSIDGIGIDPDVPVELDVNGGVDNQLAKALTVLQEKIQ